MMPDREYACPECDGNGQYACPCCGSEVGCEPCRGTGLDPLLIDLPAWLAADEAFPLPSWNWAVDGKTVGRQCRDGRTLAYADFLLEKGNADV